MNGSMRGATGWAIAALAWSGVAGGQVTRAAPRADSARADSTRADSSLVMDVAQAERWIQGVQRDAFVPRVRSTTRLTLDSLVPLPNAERRVRVTFGSAARPGARVSLAVGADGRPAREAVTPAPIPEYVQRRQVGDFGTSPERWRREEEAARVHASDLVWDLVPPIPGPRAGARRVDPVARAAEGGGEREELRGQRVTRVVGDTTVGGRRLLVVVDSARVRLVARWMPGERTLDTSVVIERTAEGVVVGRSLFDPALGLFRARVDTARLVGTAVLRYPAGAPAGAPFGGYAASTAFTAPARYERARSWTLRDAAERAAADSMARVAMQRRFGGGMVVPPPEPGTEVERRLAAGDPAVRDSLVRAWRAAADPDARAATRRLLGEYLERRPEGRALLARLDTLAWADGDEGARYAHLVAAAYTGAARGLDAAEMREAIAFMADPGRVFALGRERDLLYEDLAQGLTTWPPALPGAIARYYTPRFSCEPAACQLLAAQWPGARDPRLRAVALVARAMTEPRPWGDTLRARTGAGPVPSLLRAATYVATGVGATWPAASKRTLPPPGASWGAWLTWMTGFDPADTADAARRLPAIAGPIGDRMREQAVRARRTPRFGSTHSVAIRYEILRSGRDVIGELRRGYAAADRAGAANDTARLVFGTMLRGLGALAFTPEEVAAGLRSGEPGRVALARGALPALFSNAARADAATTVALTDALLGTVLAGREPWPRFGEDSARQTRTPARRTGPVLHRTPAPGTVFLLADSLPTALGARWRGRASVVSAAEWRAQPVRAAGVLYRVSPPLQRGPFAVITISTDERLARPDDSAPAMNAASTTYYLFDTGGGHWTVVDEEGWVT